MSDSVTILIDAENQASSELKKVGNDLEGLSKKAKEAGGQTKASIEVVGTLANAFGGSAIGSFASELAGLTEKVSAFSEVSKAGSLGAMAFKGALAGAVALVSFKVGNVIGNWAFETEKWAETLAKAAERSRELGQAQKSAMQEQFANKREDISLIADPAEREKATKAREAQLLQEKAGAEAAIKAAERQLEQANKLRDAWTFRGVVMRGERQEAAKQAEEQVKSERERMAAINAEWLAIQKLTSERTKDVEATKKANEEKVKSNAFVTALKDEVAMLKASAEEKVKLEAAKNTTPEQRGIAEQLIAERESLKAKVESEKKAEQERELAKKKEEDGIKRIAELEKKRLVDLEARRIELEKGKEAAAAFRLQQDGLTEATARRLAAAEIAMKEQEKLAEKSKNLTADTSPQQATQGRLLTRGTGGDPATQAVTKLQQLVELTKKQNKTSEDVMREIRERMGVTIKTAVVP